MIVAAVTASALLCGTSAMLRRLASKQQLSQAASFPASDTMRPANCNEHGREQGEPLWYELLTVSESARPDQCSALEGHLPDMPTVPAEQPPAPVAALQLVNEAWGRVSSDVYRSMTAAQHHINEVGASAARAPQQATRLWHRSMQQATLAVRWLTTYARELQPLQMAAAAAAMMVVLLAVLHFLGAVRVMRRAPAACKAALAVLSDAPSDAPAKQKSSEVKSKEGVRPPTVW
jgi:hypothetical protein